MIKDRGSGDPVALPQQVVHFGMVHHACAVFRCRLGKVHSQPRVIELAVIIFHATVQSLLPYGWHAFQHFVLVQNTDLADLQFAGQQVINPQAKAVIKFIDEVEGGNDEGLPAGEVRRISQQDTTLLQRLADQFDVALRQIANASMHKFGGTGGSALCEIVSFNEGHRIAAGGRIHGDAETRGPTPDHKDVPHRIAFQFFYMITPLHLWNQPPDRCSRY